MSEESWEMSKERQAAFPLSDKTRHSAEKHEEQYRLHFAETETLN